MEIRELTNNMHKAMKEGDTDRKSVLSSLLSTVKNMAIDKGCKDNIPEELITEAVLKEVKTTKEQIETCPADRKDLLDKYKTNLSILEEYSPTFLSKEEIISLLNEKYADIVSTKNKGIIMKTVMPELKGKADGKVINEVVTEMCR